MSRRRILVVDDEPRILEIVTYFLEQGGYEVVGAPSEAPALEAAKIRPFDVAVLDIVLGRSSSGYDVAGRLKKVAGSEDTPVLFMSSKVEMAELFLESYDGRAEFIRKPFRKDELLGKVASLAAGGGRRARKARRAKRS
jgi:DNA-binding response OmpR family regulator